MKFLFKILLVLILALKINLLKADTLLDSLNSAYLNNPKLNAERAKINASKQDVNISRSDF